MQLYYVQPMFTLRVTDSFSAAHRLRGYQGDCERLHGHNYKVEVSIESQYLNELAAFTDKNPSAENIARHIFSALTEAVKPPARLKEVVVWENENCSVSFSG